MAPALFCGKKKKNRSGRGVDHSPQVPPRLWMSAAVQALPLCASYGILWRNLYLSHVPPACGRSARLSTPKNKNSSRDGQARAVSQKKRTWFFPHRLLPCFRWIFVGRQWKETERKDQWKEVKIPACVNSLSFHLLLFQFLFIIASRCLSFQNAHLELQIWQQRGVTPRFNWNGVTYGVN
jgi:hypothetical protein